MDLEGNYFPRGKLFIFFLYTALYEFFIDLVNAKADQFGSGNIFITGRMNILYKICRNSMNSE